MFMSKIKLNTTKKALMLGFCSFLIPASAIAKVFDFKQETDLLSLSSSFDDQSQDLSFTYELDRNNTEGNVGTNSFWLVVTPGDEPSMDRQDAVALVGDLETGRITALAYQKGDNQIEYTEKDLRSLSSDYVIASFDNAIEIIEDGDTQRVSFAIDATEINQARPDSDTWVGAAFGDTAGYWLRLAEGANFGYDATGNLQEWETGNILRRNSELREVESTCERQISNGFEQIQTGTTTEEVCTARPGTEQICENVTRYQTVNEAYNCPEQVCNTTHHWWLFFKPETTCRTENRTCYRNTQQPYNSYECRTVNTTDEACETVEKPVYEAVEQFTTETYSCTKLERVEGDRIIGSGSGENTSATGGGGGGGGNGGGSSAVPAPTALGFFAIAGLLGMRRLRKKA